MSNTTMHLADVAAAVEARVPYLRCAFAAPPADGWLACDALIGDPDLLRTEIEATAAGRGTNDLQVAASLYVQSYAFRVPSIAVAAHALGLAIPATAPRAGAVRIGRHRPAAVAITDPQCTRMDVATFAHALFTDHLAPLVASVRSAIRVGERLLWGNVASSLATVFRAVAGDGPRGDPDVRARAGGFIAAAAPWLGEPGALGGFTTVEAPVALGWFWERTNCCLWYRTESGFMCDDCSLRDPAEVAATRLQQLTGSPSA